MPYLKAVGWKDLLELFPLFFQAMESKPDGDLKSIVLELTIIMRIMSQQEITEKELKLLNEAIPRFFDEFKKELSFDRRQDTMVKKMTLPIHMLLHMTEYNRQIGPPRRHWPFAMERTCKTVKQLTTACKEPSIARSNKLGLNPLAHIGGITELFEQKALANMPEGSESVLKKSEISAKDRTAVKKYVQEKLGVTDYNYDQSNTDFLKRVTRNGVEYARDETKPERSKICFKGSFAMRYGRIRATVKLRANQQIRTVFIVDNYNVGADVQSRSIKSRVLMPGETIRIAAFLEDGEPTEVDQVVPFEDVLSPMRLIHDPTYIETKFTLDNDPYKVTRTYIHIEDGYFHGFLSQFDWEERERGQDELRRFLQLRQQRRRQQQQPQEELRLLQQLRQQRQRQQQQQQRQQRHPTAPSSTVSFYGR
ncbi:hypothetical protein TRICI_006405 [Trichomonascus ciferrii]|uniref:Uncharacterized protein n=1 Tax=Trichomonascus ciferrii TaxID=44093 RepID=A0A642UP12_9ASCO|nr:hypothetical protein TRICI_006405 [Trichomonascus ciferrii]